MLPALLRNPVASRVSGIFRILSWLGILKTSKWGMGKITSAETREIKPGEVTCVALLPFMIVAELLDAFGFFAKPTAMQHLIVRIAEVQKSMDADPELKDGGMFEKSTYLITNSLHSKEAFAFVHSLLMVSLLCGLTLSLIRRAIIMRTPLSTNFLLVLGSFIAAFAAARHALPLSHIIKHGPYVAIILREIAVTGFNPWYIHQAWGMIFQAFASAVTAAVLYTDCGGLKGIEKAMYDGKKTEKLAILAVLVISCSVSMLRVARTRKLAPIFIPVALAFGAVCAHELSIAGKEDKLRLSRFSVVMHFAIASCAMITGSAVCVIPLVLIVQCLVKIHNPEGKLIFSR